MAWSDCPQANVAQISKPKQTRFLPRCRLSRSRQRQGTLMVRLVALLNCKGTISATMTFGSPRPHYPLELCWSATIKGSRTSQDRSWKIGLCDPSRHPRHGASRLIKYRSAARGVVVLVLRRLGPARQSHLAPDGLAYHVTRRGCRCM